MSNNKNRKVAKSEKEEYKWPRLIITICFAVLLFAYVICLATKSFSYDSPLCIVIAMAAGILLMSLAFVIKMQEKKVDLDYDSIVVWKLCFVAGLLIIAFAIFSIVVRLM